MQETYWKLNERIVPDARLCEKVLEQAVPRRKVRFGALATAAILLILLVSIPLAAYAEEWIPVIQDYVKNATNVYKVEGFGVIYEGVDEDGNGWQHIVGESHRGGPSWLETDGDRVLFIANGERIDITDEISTEEPFTYIYTDKLNLIHYMAVGRSNDELGWFVEIRDADDTAYKYSGWTIGGGGHGHWNGETQKPYGWFMKAYEELGIPWRNHLKEYYDYDPETWGE